VKFRILLSFSLIFLLLIFLFALAMAQDYSTYYNPWYYGSYQGAGYGYYPGYTGYVAMGTGTDTILVPWETAQSFFDSFRGMRFDLCCLLEA